MECHRCEHREAIEAGKYARVAFEKTPCAQCELREDSNYTIAYDAERETAADPVALGMTGEEMLPVSVMREVVLALLALPVETRNAICWRYAGFKYREVARIRSVTEASVEMRHKRALERWPVLKTLFPEKVAKQGRRKKPADGGPKAVCRSERRS